MNTLRVLLTAPPSSSRPESWAVFDDAGRCVQRGRDAPRGWPQRERREAVLAADLVRIVALTLPPMPPTRLASAAAFALEDQLATTGAPPTIAVSAQEPDGRVHACIAARDLVAAVVAWDPPFERVIAEPALAPVHREWTWYASGADGGFVRRADGSAFAIGPKPAPSQMPPELVSALTLAARSGESPASVGVAQACDDAMLAQWTREAGIPFARAAPWRWDLATSDAFGAAPDLRIGEFADATSIEPGRIARLFRPALMITATALGLVIAATIVEWTWLKLDVWRMSRSITALARDAELPDAASADAATRAIAKWHADLRHRVGRSAPADALPLLARAAPALSSLPANAFKSAIYSDGAWTIELSTVDDAALTRIDRALMDAGVTALQAKTAGGYRMRLSLAL
ncbi:MAG TPA: type II secretion system protein GspL [Casimicrobiaceae bacterium]